jgi:hypothetical protein
MLKPFYKGLAISVLSKLEKNYPKANSMRNFTILYNFQAPTTLSISTLRKKFSKYGIEPKFTKRCPVLKTLM